MSINQSNLDSIDIFIDALWLESGLSKNTLSAYRTDLRGLAKFIEPELLIKVTQAEIQKYLAFLLAHGVKSSSSARVLSTLRRFYRYQVRENCVLFDPCAQVRSPKQGRQLPKAMSEQQVGDLLEAPDVNSLLGLRDRAMLETLYATGLRVSCLLYTSPSPRDGLLSRMPSSA